MGAPPESGEDVALAPEHRRYVLDIYPRLDRLNHYEMLGVGRDADAQAIKRAYFQLVRFVHPDRYFGKPLGSFGPQIQAIFARVSAAYETLSAPARRATYDGRLAAVAPNPSAAPAPVDPAAAARRKAVLDALGQRSQASKAKAAPHVEAAARARAAGDVTAALAAYRQALTFTPNDPVLQAAHDEMARAVAERRTEAHRRQAALAEKQERWELAAASWQQVLDARPDDSEARVRLAGALARTGRPTGR